MAILTCNFRSMMLSNDTSFNLILPDKRLRQPNVLYLLHGYQQYYGSWLSLSSVAQYVSGKDIAVVMPDGGRSFYTDMVMTGEKYYSYIVNELPHFLETQFGLNPPREQTAIAGLSMGGYGALKIGIRNPESYSVIGAFSPACDIVNIARQNRDLTTVICGTSDLKDSEHDLYRLAKDMSSSECKPRIYHYCGDSDFMLKENRAFADFMRSLPLDYSYTEDVGAHEWTLWDKWVRDFIEKL